MNLLKIFTEFFKIGLFTFGGGYAMIPIIQNVVVDKRGWLTKEEFVEMLAVVQSLPGPISVNSALFIGYKTAKFWGALLALLGIVIPSFVIILFIAMVFTDFVESPLVAKAFKGIRPAVVALIASPIVNMYRVAGVNIKNLWIPVTAAVLICWCGVSPVWVILGTAVLSIAYGMAMEKHNLQKGGAK
ncbi:MAG: chromate transporter [Paludibacteraceae bacterium]|nr:chromate transporter [Paludibacteraceae bacterium]